MKEVCLSDLFFIDAGDIVRECLICGAEIENRGGSWGPRDSWPSHTVVHSIDANFRFDPDPLPSAKKKCGTCSEANNRYWHLRIRQRVLR